MIDFRGKHFDAGNKLVTIGVASYNNANYVISTLDSVYNQTYSPIEFIIIDDGSQDNSVNLIQQWIQNKQVSVTFVANEKNVGVCKVCNLFLDNTTGYFFVPFGSDDEMQRDRIEKQVNHFNNLSEEYGLIYADMAIIDESGKIIEPSFFISKKSNPISGMLFPEFLKDTFRFPSPTIMYKVNVFDVVGRYDEQLKTEDIDMVLRILAKFKASFCPMIAAHYRQLGSSLSRNVGGRFYEDRIRTYRKLLGHDTDSDTFIKSKIVVWAKSAYSIAYPKSKILLWQSLQINFTFKNFVLWIFAVCGIKAALVFRIFKS